MYDIYMWFSIYLSIYLGTGLWQTCARPIGARGPWPQTPEPPKNSTPELAALWRGFFPGVRRRRRRQS